MRLLCCAASMDAKVCLGLTALAVGALSASFVACSAAGDPRALATGGEGGSGGAGGGGGGEVGGAGPVDAGPLTPDASCGHTKIPAVRAPGQVLLVLDRSFSMNEDPDGEYPPKFGELSKWDHTKKVLKTVLGGLPDEMRMGLLLYPTSNDGCAVDPAPQVSIAPLGQTRSLILTYLTSPSGETPTEGALAAAYAHIGALGGSGKKGVVLITDGAWNCGSDDGAVHASVEAARSGPKAVLTFAVGVPGSSPDGLSKLAYEGGTAKSSSCVLDCGSSPENQAQCCHHVTNATTFEEDLETALGEIASRITTSCVFAVPKGEDPAKFDPGLVNLVLTEDGEPPAFVPQGLYDGWSWVGGGTDAVEVSGSACDAIAQGASVEIMLGCPSVMK
jgi:hypothetical protein